MIRHIALAGFVICSLQGLLVESSALADASTNSQASYFSESTPENVSHHDTDAPFSQGKFSIFGHLRSLRGHNLRKFVVPVLMVMSTVAVFFLIRGCARKVMSSKSKRRPSGADGCGTTMEEVADKDDAEEKADEVVAAKDEVVAAKDKDEVVAAKDKDEVVAAKDKADEVVAAKDEEKADEVVAAKDEVVAAKDEVVAAKDAVDDEEKEAEAEEEAEEEEALAEKAKEPKRSSSLSRLMSAGAGLAVGAAIYYYAYLNLMRNGGMGQGQALPAPAGLADNEEWPAWED